MNNDKNINKSDLRIYNTKHEKNSCGVGFITRKDGVPTHDLIQRGHEALCYVPHRGGMDAQGVGDGGGVLVDLSQKFFSKIAGTNLELSKFGVGHFFLPENTDYIPSAKQKIEQALSTHNISTLLWRDVETDKSVINAAAQLRNPTIAQIIFTKDNDAVSWEDFEKSLITISEDLGDALYEDENYKGFYSISLSSRTTVYKGCLLSNEVIPYFKDLMDSDFESKILLFHTRYSTNTAPHPSMAQPFMRMAHNGELNTDKKNRIQEDSVLRTKGKRLIVPPAQSDSARCDQTLARRLKDENISIVEAFVRMSPPAWENSTVIKDDIKDMLEYFSLSEEKVDGPAALIFTDGVRVGAKLDRLGLRPLRQIETTEYISVMSEAGQNAFDPSDVISRGRISAGGMVVYNHDHKHYYSGGEVLDILKNQQDYTTLLNDSVIRLSDLPEADDMVQVPSALNSAISRGVTYGHNAESFRFMLDPILETGAERVSAMGYGNAINALSNIEGGVSKYFSQRFAQVTNPPLDSIRESDGMTVRVSLGAKPTFSQGTKQIILDSPVLSLYELAKIEKQSSVNVDTISATFQPNENDDKNKKSLLDGLNTLTQSAIECAKNNGIIIVDDSMLSTTHTAIPMVLAVAHINRGLIKNTVRFNTSLVVKTGQAVSSHDTAVLLGFGASAVCSTLVFDRASELFPDDIKSALKRYQKGCEKALMKTMGKFGLCTIESYSGGEFFEGNFIDTKNDPVLKSIFPNVDSPVGGVGFADIARSVRDWHIQGIKNPEQYPNIGLFKEKSDGAGHSFGVLATKEFISISTENIRYAKDASHIPFGTWVLDEHLDISKKVLGDSKQYLDFGYEPLSASVIRDFTVTSDYRDFSKNLMVERMKRPSALRDVLALPLDITTCETQADFEQALSSYIWESSLWATIKGLPEKGARKDAFDKAVVSQFGDKAEEFITKISTAPTSIGISTVQSVNEICKTFASGAMSFGALNRNAHEAVALGTNLVGANSNCGEGGEQYTRYNTPKSSTIKQIASGRFGVWAGYFADPNLREIEIKLAQGAKPGEGGQLPAKKVTVEIASMRGGTPMVELVSPPPHHDTYSIEDLAQLIHDAHCARVKVIVKLVSSEGIGTIAVGVAKAGADVINIAGNTGGTGAAQVTSLKNAGRSPELGIAECHQALCDNGLRDKVILRNSGAFQNGYDVIKSAILGADSFEFGTTALMLIGCVMAKNCNIKCPAGLTTDPELFAGDARALAQYFLNLSHEVREILASLGFKDLTEIRGRTDLLNLINHPSLVGTLDLKGMLNVVEEKHIKDPKYLEACYTIDDKIIADVKAGIIAGKDKIEFSDITLHNRHKSVGGQTAIDIERLLSYEMDAPSACVQSNGKRPVLNPETVIINTNGSAGQSYGVFTTSGMKLSHTGVVNDGLGKSMCGGIIVVKNPGLSTKKTSADYVENVLVGNFALFGATGGKVFIEGEAGDRFAVRNTGTSSVVEGLGEFGCEYMVNGTILNIGGFGKGFGNGMSGGIAYQYDPQNLLKDLYSHDSVHLGCLSEEIPESKSHEILIKAMLEEHIKYTGSPKAQALLNDWESVRGAFYYIVPLPLYDTQRPSNLMDKISDKLIIEELTKGYGVKVLRDIKSAYMKDTKIQNGIRPNDNGDNTVRNHVDLIASFAILGFAKIRAEKIILDLGLSLDEYMLNQHTKKLIITENKEVLGDITNALHGALKDTEKSTLAVWLSEKRVADYAEALAGRDTLELHIPATDQWIEGLIKSNKLAIESVGTMQQVLSDNLTHGILKSFDLKDLTQIAD